MSILHTTFTLLREHYTCEKEYDKLVRRLGGVDFYGDTTPIPLDIILRTNGFFNTLWCIKAVQEDYQTVVRPLLSCYLADILEHTCGRNIPVHANNILQRGVVLLRDLTTTTEQFITFAQEAQDEGATWAIGSTWTKGSIWATGATWTKVIAKYAQADKNEVGYVLCLLCAQLRLLALEAKRLVSEKVWETKRFHFYLSGKAEVVDRR